MSFARNSETRVSGCPQRENLQYELSFPTPSKGGLSSDNFNPESNLPGNHFDAFFKGMWFETQFAARFVNNKTRAGRTLSGLGKNGTIGFFNERTVQVKIVFY